MRNLQLTIALIQMRSSPDSESNLRRAVDMIHEAARSGAAIVCLPELFRSHYFCKEENAKLFNLAEPIPGPTSEQLCETAHKLKITIVGSLFEKRAAGVYHNTAITIDEHGQIIGKYRKMHIPDDPLYYEKYYFTPGDLGFIATPTKQANLGVLVCWDQWFPEAARLTALRGAEILFYPTAIGWHPSEKNVHGSAQREAWQTIQRSHAIANGCFVCAVNRVGYEDGPAGSDGIEFWGSSFICDPFGRILVQGAVDEEEIVMVECDLRLIEETRRNWPFLRDRRIDAYDGISQRIIDSNRP